MIRHVTEDLKPLRLFNPEVPDGLQQVLSFMVAKDPSQRYPTPERAARALQLFLPAVQTPEEIMPEKPAKPTTGTPEIPTGKLVTGNARPEKPAIKPKAKPVEPTAPVPLPDTAAPQVTASPGDFDVELVAIPAPPPVKPRRPGDKRSLLELDQRDFLLLGAGVAGTIIAVLMGLVLAKAVSGKKPAESPTAIESTQKEQTLPAFHEKPARTKKTGTR